MAGGWLFGDPALLLSPDASGGWESGDGWLDSLAWPQHTPRKLGIVFGTRSLSGQRGTTAGKPSPVVKSTATQPNDLG